MLTIVILQVNVLLHMYKFIYVFVSENQFRKNILKQQHFIIYFLLVQALMVQSNETLLLQHLNSIHLNNILTYFFFLRRKSVAGHWPPDTREGHPLILIWHRLIAISQAFRNCHIIIGWGITLDAWHLWSKERFEQVIFTQNAKRWSRFAFQLYFFFQ